MNKAIICLGPPLSGKSTEAIKLGIPRFSVRHFFEKRRKELSLPPVGTFLSDEIVINEVDRFIRNNEVANELVFDGFPGNSVQAEWLINRLDNEYEVDLRYFDIDKKTAKLRMNNRKVCYTCDGGADPVEGDVFCPRCGSLLKKREDDNPEAFERRWAHYWCREREMVQSGFQMLKNAILTPHGSRRMDLHIHTTLSDGTEAPEEIVQKVKNEGIQLFAVTDHDSICGIEKCKQLAKENNLEYVKAVEINAVFRGKVVHLLGYGISENDKALKDVLQKNNEARKVYDEKVLKILEERGILSYRNVKDFEDYVYDAQRGGWKLLNYLIDIGICKDGYEYFNLLARIQAETIDYQSAASVIDAIRKTGKCVLAHPGTYKWGTHLTEILDVFRNMGIDGIEVFHPLHTENVMIELYEYCGLHSLIRTGGSDYHGKNLPDRILGKPKVYKELLNNSME